jgi:hypothetical protein
LWILYVMDTKTNVMTIDSFGIDEKKSYSNMNELIIVFSFFKTQCNYVLVMITWVEMSINDIGHNHGKGIERDYLMVQGLHGFL